MGYRYLKRSVPRDNRPIKTIVNYNIPYNKMMNPATMLDFSQENTKIVSDMLKFLIEKSDIEKTFAKSLSRLLSCKLFTHEHSSLSSIISSAKSHYSVLSRSFHERSETTIKLYKSLKSAAHVQKSTAKSQQESLRKLDIDTSKTLKHYEKARQRYFKACMDSEMTSKFESKYFVCKEIEEEAFKDYTRQLINVNKTFTLIEPSILKQFEKFERSRLSVMKKSFKKLLQSEDFSHEMFRSSVLDFSTVIECYDPNADISSLFPSKESFMSLNHSKLDKEIVVENSSLKDAMARILEKPWRGVEITEQDIEEFSQIIKEKSGIRIWCGLLNSKRTSGEFTIPKATFEQIGQLMNLALDSIMESEDYEFLKYCIILSQTFFSENTEKEFLQSFIRGHAIWKKEDLWSRLIQDSANEEIAKYLSFSQNQVVDEELAGKIRSIFTSQVIAFVHIMACFEEPQSNILALVQGFKEKYDLCDEVIDFIDTFNC